MLINLTNHPYTDWSDVQKQSANHYGQVIDLPFPMIDPSWGTNELLELCNEYTNNIVSLKSDEPIVVHVMGEMSFTVLMVSKLIKSGIKCIASTSERYSETIEAGKKEVIFRFVRFREYSL